MKQFRTLFFNTSQNSKIRAPNKPFLFPPESCDGFSQQREPQSSQHAFLSSDRSEDCVTPPLFQTCPRAAAPRPHVLLHTCAVTSSCVKVTPRWQGEWRRNDAAGYKPRRRKRQSGSILCSDFNLDWTAVDYQRSSWTWPRHNGCLMRAQVIGGAHVQQ